MFRTREEVELIRAVAFITGSVAKPLCRIFGSYTADYVRYGTQIKCNPSVKTTEDRDAILEAIDKRDIQTIGSDHAPHTWEEKQNNYMNAPSGIPLIQHTCQMLMECVRQERIGITSFVDAFCHTPAHIFGISERGFKGRLLCDWC